MNLESLFGKLLLAGAGLYGMLLAAAFLFDLCMGGFYGAESEVTRGSPDLRRQAAETT